MPPQTIFSSLNDHQVGRSGAVVLSEATLLLCPESVPATDAESGRGGRFSQLIWRPSLGHSETAAVETGRMIRVKWRELLLNHINYS